MCVCPTLLNDIAGLLIRSFAKAHNYEPRQFKNAHLLRTSQVNTTDALLKKRLLSCIPGNSQSLFDAHQFPFPLTNISPRHQSLFLSCNSASKSLPSSSYFGKHISPTFACIRLGAVLTFPNLFIFRYQASTTQCLSRSSPQFNFHSVLSPQCLVCCTPFHSYQYPLNLFSISTSTIYPIPSNFIPR